MGRNKGGEREREIRRLITESGGALLFLHRFLVDQSPSMTARKKKDLCAKVLMYFTCQNKREREKKERWHSSFHVVWDQ